MRIALSVVIIGLFGLGATQQCEQNATLSVPFGSVTIGVVNTTDPFCFICGGDVNTFSLAGVMLSNGQGYFIDTSINALVINNWTSLTFNPLQSIMVQCVTTGTAITYSGTFFSSPGGALVIMPLTPFNESSDVSVNCVNQNGNFRGSPQWKAPDGSNIDGFRDAVIATLAITGVTRQQAGTYTCVVPGVPEVPTGVFELVVQFRPEVTIANPPNRTEDIGSTLTLDCSYVGVPSPEVTWTLNGTAINATASTDISLSTVELSGSLTSRLMVSNISPMTAKGEYQCLLVNSLGMASGTYNVRIATPPEPATMFNVTEVTNASISLSWMMQFDGLKTVTGARLEFVTGTQTPRSEEVSGFSGTISGLTPFAYYNITIRLRNQLGLSDPVTIMQQTDSNFLDAPSISLTADSSTQLTLTWSAPPFSALVESASNWRYEFSRVDGTDMRMMTVGAATLTEDFTGLAKGTMYRARVAGINSRGVGQYSDFMVTETRVDPPSAPVSLSVSGITSFAVQLEWRGPSDNGGRPVTNYVIQILDTMGAQVLSMNYPVGNGVEPFSMLINNMTLLTQNTTYTVSVAGMNTAGVGDNITRSVDTISIDRPQTLLVAPTGSEVTNISATISWPFPGGTVTFYVITLTEQTSQIAMNITVNGTETSVVVDDLKPGTTYVVTILVANDLNGLKFSTASPLASFDTRDPPPPTITANPETGPYEARTTVVLTCVTVDDSEPIKWSKVDGPDLEGLSGFTMSGTNLMSTLTITDLREDNAGIYRCDVGNTRAEFNLEVFTPTTERPTNAPLSMTTIIIIAVVAGAGVLIVIGVIVVIAVICLCCKGGDDTSRKAGYSPKKKKGKDLFEISSNFTPTTNTGITRESNVSFTMPEDFQAHSSFNTLEKQNKIERSGSPDVSQPTSFGGGNRSSTDGLMSEYQAPPSDGTML